MFRIDLLPAEFGDAVWIEYGDAAAPHRILIDCGTAAVFPRLRERILALPAEARHFELFVVTHVDADHIGGALKLLAARDQLGVTFGEIWFNGFVHLSPGGSVPRAADDKLLGPLQGEALTEMIVANGTATWNAAVAGGALVVPEAGPLTPLPALPGGMRFTLLSPGQTQLDKLRPVWDAACRKAGIVPGAATAADAGALDEFDEAPPADFTLSTPDLRQLAASAFKPDQARPNGSSIALLAEYDGRRVLLGADAFAPVLVDALQRLADRPAGRLPIDAVKMPHHGSRGNTSLELVKAVQCPNWLVSTNGKQFQHPDDEALARAIIGSGPGVTLHFNYRSEFNQLWASPALQKAHGFRAVYPATESAGASLLL